MQLQKPTIVFINYKGLPNNCLGHEIHFSRCILIDFLLQKKIDLNITIVTVPDRFFLYTSIFKNIISDVDYSNIPNKDHYDVYDITEYTSSSSGNIYDYCKDLFLRINYKIPDKYYTPEFQNYVTKISYLPLEINTDFILIHHRYGASIDQLKTILDFLHNNFSNLNIVMFNNDIDNLKSHFLDKSNIVYINHLQTYASYMNHLKCKFFITEFSGGGQLANYCCNTNTYIHFNKYSYISNMYKNRTFDYVLDLPELLNYALSDTYIECYDFKKFSNVNLKTFYNIEQLLENIYISER